MAKKRANGEGSIRKRPHGRWEGRFTVGVDPNTGRAIRDNRGIPVNHNGDYTVADWCRLWFEPYSKPNIRYNTAKSYESIIEQHIIPAIGAVRSSSSSPPSTSSGYTTNPKPMGGYSGSKSRETRRSPTASSGASTWCSTANCSRR